MYWFIAIAILAEAIIILLIAFSLKRRKKNKKRLVEVMKIWNDDYEEHLDKYFITHDNEKIVIHQRKKDCVVSSIPMYADRAMSILIQMRYTSNPDAVYELMTVTTKRKL